MIGTGEYGLVAVGIGIGNGIRRNAFLTTKGTKDAKKKKSFGDCESNSKIQD